jgi:hypothetical protein
MASLCADGLASRGKTLLYVVGEHHASGDPLTDVRADMVHGNHACAMGHGAL